MATKRKRGDRWEYCVRRKKLLPKPIYLYFTDPDEGDNFVENLEKLLNHGIIPERFKPKETKSLSLVRDLIRQYLTTITISKSDTDLMNVLLERIGLLPVSTITYDWAENWIQEMKTIQQLSPTTIRHYVGATARCFDWAQRKGLLVNPLRVLPKRYATTGNDQEEEFRDERCDPHEEDLIFEAIGDDIDMLMLFILAIESAMRLREMYTLTRDQVDFKKRTIFLDKTKNGDKRQVPMNSIVMRCMAVYMKKKKGIIFPWWNGDRSARELKRTTSLLSKKFGRVFEQVGLQRLNFHDLRHEATSRLYERTRLSDIQIAKITGHKDLRTLKRYANLRGSNLADELW